MRPAIAACLLLACRQSQPAVEPQPPSTHVEEAAATEQPGARERRREVERGLRELVHASAEAPLRALEDRLRHYRVPGASVAVIRGGRIDWAAGYGYRSMADLEPVGPETIFQIGSISKPVTAVAFLRLAQDGVIDLDRPLEEQLSAWTIPDSPLRGSTVITPRRLLGHRAGLTMGGVPGWFYDEEPQTLVETLRGGPLDDSSVWRHDDWYAEYPAVTMAYDPAREWRYSGGGFCALQLLAEEATGTSFDAVMQEQVFAPLGLDRSSTVQWLPHEAPANVATGHLEHGEVVPGGWQRLPCVTAAGVWTTAPELATVFIEIWRAARGESALLDRETALAMLEPQEPAPPLFEGYGLALVREGLDGPERFGHHGSNGFYQAAAVMHLDSGDGVVVLTNGWQGFPLAEEIIGSVARTYGWKGYGTRRRSKLTEADAAPYLGSYLLELETEKRTARVEWDRGELYLRIEGDDEHILYPAHPAQPGELFILREGHARPVRFDVRDRRAVGFVLHMGPRALPATRQAVAR